MSIAGINTAFVPLVLRAFEAKKPKEERLADLVLVAAGPEGRNLAIMGAKQDPGSALVTEDNKGVKR